MNEDVVHTLMGILAVYCDLGKEGVLRGSMGAIPLRQQKAIDEFARMNDCEISWNEEHKRHLWRTLDST